jgi:hypothetical protein
MEPLSPYLDALVGRWTITGPLVTGKTRFEWAGEKYFLIQHFDLTNRGRQIAGMEVIGRLCDQQRRQSSDIWSRAYFYGDGLTLDYVYQLEGRDLTIWLGQRGADNFMQARLDEDGSRFTGAWQWPGGGYSFDARRE